MSDNNNDLYEQVLQVLEGDPAWIKRANENKNLTGIQFLAVILYTIRDVEDKTRDQKKIVTDWAFGLAEAVKQEEYDIYDYHSYFPIKSPEGFDWIIPLRSADEFIRDNNGGWTCTEQVAFLFRDKFPNEQSSPKLELPSNKRRWTNDNLKSLWEESLLPDVTQEVLATKHGVGRRRISNLLRFLQNGQAKRNYFHLTDKN
ncbi:MAG: hypothetical protein H0U72_13925 [Nitrosospira sp.]|nr:hypothetical protein [Nitrosospira sp.]